MDTNVYKKTLQDSGYKLTKQRKDILMVMIEHHDKHLSCDEIYRYVTVRNKELGIATVYRTLQLFESLNMVYKINFDEKLLNGYLFVLHHEIHDIKKDVCITCFT